MGPRTKSQAASSRTCTPHRRKQRLWGCSACLRSGGGLLRVHSLSAAGLFLRPRLYMFQTANQWERTVSKPNSRLFSSQHTCGAGLCSIPCWSLEPPVTFKQKYSRLRLSPAMMEWLQGTLYLLQVLFCPQIMVSYSLRDQLSPSTTQHTSSP